ncbi:glycosyltransferase family 39 protein [Pleurocapsa sp. PCC 7319]|uniref:glycosyltransferase family 39 protein n=1 Tax=Pleurocapsa sp. PCC 7319 TaxID=118161 RepID=UPI000345040B|nr:glycosyltransferase family 39 protein [Pleurocapsa sp. PCC 7319]
MGLLTKSDRFGNRHHFYQFSLIFLITVLLGLGVFFRFANLETKVFWVDEAATITRVAGYTQAEIIDDLISQDIVDIDTLLSYQRITPERTIQDTFNALLKSPEHAPLYFILTRILVQLTSSSIANIRILSAIFSLLIFPCLYWLARELFASYTVSWIAVSLMSVSPFFVAYAQEARPYSLWTIGLLLMSASFLKALRSNSWQPWIGYIFSTIFAFYTSLFSIFVAIAQGVYLLLLRKNFKFQVMKKYLLAMVIIILAFSPWLIVIFNSTHLVHENTTWMRNYFDFATVIAVWIGSILLIFGDLPLDPNTNPIQIGIILVGSLFLFSSLFLIVSLWNKFSINTHKIISYSGVFCFFIVSILIFNYPSILVNHDYFNPVVIIGTIVALFILMLSAYSSYYLKNKSNTNTWMFIASLILAIPIPLFILDLINQGLSSATPRYLMPSKIGIQLAVAYTFNKYLFLHYDFQSIKTKTFWRAIALLLLTVGIVSCTLNLNKSPIYQKNRNIHNIPIAQIINQQDSPLIFAEADSLMDMLSLSHYLSAQVKFKLINPAENYLSYTNQFENIFILRPSRQLKQYLQADQNIKLESAYIPEIFSLNDIFIELLAIDLK